MRFKRPMQDGKVPQWISLGNFSLGFGLAALAVRSLAFHLVDPLVRSDETGASASIAGPMILLFMLLVGLAGGIISIFLVRAVSKVSGKVTLPFTAIGGYFMWMFIIVEVARNFKN